MDIHIHLPVWLFAAPLSLAIWAGLSSFVLYVLPDPTTRYRALGWFVGFGATGLPQWGIWFMFGYPRVGSVLAGLVAAFAGLVALSALLDPIASRNKGR